MQNWLRHHKVFHFGASTQPNTSCNFGSNFHWKKFQPALCTQKVHAKLHLITPPTTRDITIGAADDVPICNRSDGANPQPNRSLIRQTRRSKRLADKEALQQTGTRNWETGQTSLSASRNAINNFHKPFHLVLNVPDDKHRKSIRIYLLLKLREWRNINVVLYFYVE